MMNRGYVAFYLGKQNMPETYKKKKILFISSEVLFTFTSLYAHIVLYKLRTLNVKHWNSMLKINREESCGLNVTRRVACYVVASIISWIDIILK